MAHTGRRGHVSISRSWLADPRLTDSALRLMLWLDSHTDDYLNRLDQKRIAGELGWSRDRVRRTLDDLVALELVTVEQVPGSNIGTRTRLTVNVDAWTSATSQGTDQCHTVRHTSATSQGTPVPYGKAPSTSRCSDEESTTSHAPSFDEFWALYPNKQGKTPARRKWDRMKPDDRTDATAALHDWCAHWRARGEPQFIPHGSTWLNQERWKDTIPALPGRRQLGALRIVQQLAGGAS